MSFEHSAVEVADKIIRLSNEMEQPATPMQVQKLVYFSHAWLLGLGYGPLFRDPVESWQYGPVVREVYHSLKHHGAQPIREPILGQESQFSEAERNMMVAVVAQYGGIDALELSRMTHAPGSPWDQTYQRDPRSQIIHNHVIAEYHADLIRQRSEA